jgi:dihydroneopterin aldolase
MPSTLGHGLPGTVGLRGLRCLAQQGSPAAGTTLLVDVSIDIDLSAVATSDSYDDVVDLADLADFIRAAIKERTWVLLETIAVHAARGVLQRYSTVQQAHVRVVKPNPAGLDAAEESVHVSIARGKAG